MIFLVDNYRLIEKKGDRANFKIQRRVTLLIWKKMKFYSRFPNQLKGGRNSRLETRLELELTVIAAQRTSTPFTLRKKH